MRRSLRKRTSLASYKDVDPQLSLENRKKLLLHNVFKEISARIQSIRTLADLKMQQVLEAVKNNPDDTEPFNDKNTTGQGWIMTRLYREARKEQGEEVARSPAFWSTSDLQDPAEKGNKLN